MTRSALSAVIVSYRTPREVDKALASLRRQTRAPDVVVIVDNAAGEAENLHPEHLQNGWRLLEAAENLGYGAGCNFGAQASTGEFLLLMNPDVVLDPAACERMLERIQSDARLAVVGPKTFSHGRLEPSARAFPSMTTAFLGRRSFLTRVLARVSVRPGALSHAHGRPQEVDWVAGSCMLVRRAAFEEVGGFDEQYWMYWEDADLCRRLTDRGWRVVFEPSAVIDHAIGASGVSERTIRAFHESAARLAETYLVQGQIRRTLVRFLLAVRARFALARHRLKERPIMR